MVIFIILLCIIGTMGNSFVPQDQDPKISTPENGTYVQNNETPVCSILINNIPFYIMWPKNTGTADTTSRQETDICYTVEERLGKHSTSWTMFVGQSAAYGECWSCCVISDIIPSGSTTNINSCSQYANTHICPLLSYELEQAVLNEQLVPDSNQIDPCTIASTQVNAVTSGTAIPWVQKFCPKATTSTTTINSSTCNFDIQMGNINDTINAINNIGK